MTMSDFKERLLQEKNDLEKKVSKLEHFVVSDRFYKLSEANMILLKDQLKAMTAYLNILLIRLELLN